MTEKIISLLVTVGIQLLAIYSSSRLDNSSFIFILLIIGFIAGMVLNFSNATTGTFSKTIGFGLFYGTLIIVALIVIILVVMITSGIQC